MKKILLAIGITFFFVSASFAVDLVNKDSKTYDVKVHDVGTTHTSVSGNTTKAGICSSCEIEIPGVGSVKASGSDVVVIENGSVSK